MEMGTKCQSKCNANPTKNRLKLSANATQMQHQHNTNVICVQWKRNGKFSLAATVRGVGLQIPAKKAFVLSKVCMDMQVSPVDSISQWKHLTGVDLADLEFGMPGRIDVLLGAYHYREVLLMHRGRVLVESLKDDFNQTIPQQTAYNCITY